MAPVETATTAHLEPQKVAANEKTHPRINRASRIAGEFLLFFSSLAASGAVGYVLKEGIASELNTSTTQTQATITDTMSTNPDGITGKIDYQVQEAIAPITKKGGTPKFSKKAYLEALGFISLASAGFFKTTKDFFSAFERYNARHPESRLEPTPSSSPKLHRR